MMSGKTVLTAADKLIEVTSDHKGYTVRCVACVSPGLADALAHIPGCPIICDDECSDMLPDPTAEPDAIDRLTAMRSSATSGPSQDVDCSSMCITEAPLNTALSSGKVQTMQIEKMLKSEELIYGGDNADVLQMSCVDIVDRWPSLEEIETHGEGKRYDIKCYLRSPNDTATQHHLNTITMGRTEFMQLAALMKTIDK